MEMYLSNNSFEDKKEKFYSYNLSIKQNCFRLIKLINNILDLSKIKSGFEKFSSGNENIVEVVEDIVESVSDYVTYKELNIIFDTDTEEKIIACDPEKIERIMLNLISNAIKFSNPGGDIFVNVSDKGEFVEILVKDNGIGIDKMHLDSIFKRFYQEDKSLSRNAEGSGIGLSLVKSFVEMHGGEIKVESEIGKGSTFTIRLPSKAAEQNSEIKSETDIKNKIDLLSIEFSDIYY
jgi:signal transduction histidine kinase